MRQLDVPESNTLFFMNESLYNYSLNWFAQKQLLIQECHIKDLFQTIVFDGARIDQETAIFCLKCKLLTNSLFIELLKAISQSLYSTEYQHNCDHLLPKNNLGHVILLIYPMRVIFSLSWLWEGRWKTSFNCHGGLEIFHGDEAAHVPH